MPIKAPKIRLLTKQGWKAMFQTSWDSITEIERHLEMMKGLAWAVMILSAIAIVIYQRHTAKYESRLTELKELRAAAEEKNRADKLDSQLAESKKSVADLLVINKEIAKRLASRSEILTVDTKRRLVEQIKSLPPKSVGLRSTVSDQESLYFVGALEEVLNAANLLRSTQMTTGGGGGITIGGPGPGIAVLFSGDKPGAANTLRDALIEAGLPGVRLEKSTAPFPGGESVLILVGPK